MSNELKYLILHCTATPEGRPVTAEQIIQWHTAPKEKGGRGWSRPGYSDLILLDGSLVNLVPWNTDNLVDPWELTNGAQGLNGNARHLVYAGGMDRNNQYPKDTRTEQQKDTMGIYVRYLVRRHPHLQVMGHNQSPYAKGKACPAFDVPAWLKSIGIPEQPIYKATGN